MGVWIEIDCDGRSKNNADVTPCVGVWIEILWLLEDGRKVESLPAWGCGLKLEKYPLVGKMLVRHSLRGGVD